MPDSLGDHHGRNNIRLVDSCVCIKHGCVSREHGSLLTPRAQLETNPILPGAGPRAGGR